MLSKFLPYKEHFTSISHAGGSGELHRCFLHGFCRVLARGRVFLGVFDQSWMKALVLETQVLPRARSIGCNGKRIPGTTFLRSSLLPVDSRLVAAVRRGF